MTKLKCYKCGGSLVAKKNHNIAVCQECNSLIILPNYVFDNNKNIEEVIKITEKVNKAIDYQLNYQFHHAYNQYDKLLKNYPELKDNEYFFYYGKFMAQYGIVYHYNKRLENELVSLQIADDSVFENENYQKAYELMDLDTQILFKKEISNLDSIITDIYRKALNYKPLDIVICIDDSKNNLALDNDLKELKKLTKFLDEHGYSYKVTQDLFNEKNIETYLSEYYPLLKTADMMIVISHNEEHLNSGLFRHTWMSYFRLPENKRAINERLMILTNSNPSSPMSEYLYSNEEVWKKKIVENLKKIRNNSYKLTTIPIIDEFLTKSDFKNAKLILNDINERDYLYWWCQLLIKYEVTSLVELKKKNVAFDKEYYYKQAYLKAPKEIRKQLYDLYETSLSVGEESYEDNINKLLTKSMIKRLLNLSKWSLLFVLFIVLCFATCSLKHIISAIIFIVSLGLISIPLIKNYRDILKQGKTAMAFDSEKARHDYIKQMKKIMKPEQILSIIPYKKQKQVNIISTCVMVLLLVGLGFFLSKEIRLASKYSNLEYYYIFDKAYISGGDGKNIIIPSTIGDKKVIRINQNAFQNKDKIETLEINYGLKEIGSSAFYDCDNLKQIILPASLENVGHNAPFEECNDLILLRYSGKIKEETLLGDEYYLKMLNLTIEKSSLE